MFDGFEERMNMGMVWLCSLNVHLHGHLFHNFYSFSSYETSVLGLIASLLKPLKKLFENSKLHDATSTKDSKSFDLDENLHAVTRAWSLNLCKRLNAAWIK